MKKFKVSRQHFEAWFYKALEDTVSEVETRLKISIPRNYIVELQGAGVIKQLLPVEAALEKLYISETLTYRKIDVAILRVEDNIAVVYVRASGHEPGPWESSFNFAQGKGPFDQLVYQDFRVNT